MWYTVFLAKSDISKHKRQSFFAFFSPAPLSLSLSFSLPLSLSFKRYMHSSSLSLSLSFSQEIYACNVWIWLTLWTRCQTTSDGLCWAGRLCRGISRLLSLSLFLSPSHSFFLTLPLSSTFPPLSLPLPLSLSLSHQDACQLHRNAPQRGSIVLNPRT